MTDLSPPMRMADMQAGTVRRAPSTWALREALSRVSPGAVILAALFVVMATLGRYFAKLDIGFSWLHPTEVCLAVALVAGLALTPWREWIARLRATRMVIPLAIIWVFGAIATARGLLDWGFSMVLYDVGLVEYSVLLLILVIVVRSRADFVLLSTAIAFGGIGAILSDALIWWAPTDWNVGSTLLLIEAASGQCICFYVAWIVSRVSAGVSVRAWHYPVAIIGVILVIFDASRGTWIALLAGAFAVPVILAASRRQAVAAALASVLILGAGIGLSLPTDNQRFSDGPLSSAASTTAGLVLEPPSSVPNSLSSRNGNTGGPSKGTSGGGSAKKPGGASSGAKPGGAAPPAPAPPSTTPVVGEIDASFAGPSSEQGTNSDWRLAYWKFLLQETESDPVFGVGFGKPSDFHWHGVAYDTRTITEALTFNVTGAHNSFVAMVYRAGVPALLALVALMAIAVIRGVALVRRTSGRDRALATWPIAALAVATVEASLNVSLENPYLGVFFWAALGLALLAPLMIEPGSRST